FVDMMEQDRIIGPGDGAKPREILVGPGDLPQRRTERPRPAAARTRTPRRAKSAWARSTSPGAARSAAARPRLEPDPHAVRDLRRAFLRDGDLVLQRVGLDLLARVAPRGDVPAAT